LSKKKYFMRLSNMCQGIRTCLALDDFKSGFAQDIRARKPA
jgi:hypothetical protein